MMKKSALSVTVLASQVQVWPCGCLLPSHHRMDLAATGHDLQSVFRYNYSAATMMSGS